MTNIKLPSAKDKIPRIKKEKYCPEPGRKTMILAILKYLRPRPILSDMGSK
jgi:hypothetical protein